MKKTLIILIGALALSATPPAYAEKDNPKPPKAAGQKIAKTAWSRSLKTASSKRRFFPEAAAPLLNNGRVYAGTHGGHFYAVDAANGKTIWQFASNGPIASQPVADADSVYFGNNEGTVYALEAQTGKKRWEYYVGGEVLGQPALDSGTLYVVTTSREVYALDAESGRERWVVFVRGYEKRFTMRGNSPVVANGAGLYIGFADGQVVSLSKRDGGIRWSRTLANGSENFTDVDSALLPDGSSLYATGYFGRLVKLEADSGRVIWSKELQSGTDLAMDDQALYASSLDGQVIAFDKKTGTRRWEVALNSGTLSAPALVRDTLVVGAEKGGAFVLSADRGSVLQRLPVSSGYLGNAVTRDSDFYLLSSGGKLYSLRLSRP